MGRGLYNSTPVISNGCAARIDVFFWPHGAFGDVFDKVCLLLHISDKVIVTTTYSQEIRTLVGWEQRARSASAMTAAKHPLPQDRITDGWQHKFTHGIAFEDDSC